jgi:hypothetical protein
MAGMSAPSEAIRRPVNAGMNMSLEKATVKVAPPVEGRGVPAVQVVPAAMATGAWSDEDWGSSAPLSSRALYSISYLALALTAFASSTAVSKGR